MTRLVPHPEGYPIKLVFDKTPETINPTGEPGELHYGSCPEGAADHYLKLKLAEEVAEYLLIPSKQELADVFAVVEALCHLYGLDLTQLGDIADERGGFSKHTMMYGYHEEFDGKEEKALERLS